MPSYRRLPNKKWQAEVLLPVRLPNGRQKRVTKSHVSKAVVREWATKLEAAIDAGTYADPRGGEVTLRDYYNERWLPARMVTAVTADKTASHWRNHIEPAFGGHPIAALTRDALKRWVKDMHSKVCRVCLTRPAVTRSGAMVRHKNRHQRACNGAGQSPGLGPHTIHGVVSTMSAILAAAVEEGLLPGNPAARLPLPRVDAKPLFYWTKAQAAAIALAAGSNGLMIELGMHTGLRWGELAGLKRRYVDLGSSILWVVGVQTRKGWREYPKSKRSRRVVPIPPRLAAAIAARCADLGPEDFIFPAPDGGAWDDSNFRRRVFDPAVSAANVPRGTPHDMRHTAASWLVQAGVDLYRVQALLGHESFATTQRYAHLAPDHFGAVIDAWGEETS